MAVSVVRKRLVFNFIGYDPMPPESYHRRFVRAHTHDDVAVANRDELVERVHHRQQVVGDNVVRIALERTLQHNTRAGLVVRAKQLEA